jgi:hypothetical protein
VPESDSLTAICEAIVKKMWDPLHPKILQAIKAYDDDSVLSSTLFFR